MSRIEVVVAALGVGFVIWMFGTLMTDIFMSKLLSIIQWFKKATKTKKPL